MLDSGLSQGVRSGSIVCGQLEEGGWKIGGGMIRCGVLKTFILPRVSSPSSRVVPTMTSFVGVKLHRQYVIKGAD